MKRRVRLGLGLGAALALAGCGSLVPPAERPSAPLRESFRVGAETGEPALADGAAAHDWDTFFVDERLRQVVGLALAGNRSLRAGVAAVERARAQYGIASAARWPRLDGTVSAGRQPDGDGGGTRYAVALGVPAWEIDLFDRVVQPARRGARALPGRRAEPGRRPAAAGGRRRRRVAGTGRRAAAAAVGGRVAREPAARAGPDRASSTSWARPRDSSVRVRARPTRPRAATRPAAPPPPCGRA
ncbi:MAG: TolC family protein [Comamonadaceae bacterium]|nr:TolC family protein [Comamonadaceae bacterium]